MLRRLQVSNRVFVVGNKRSKGSAFVSGFLDGLGFIAAPAQTRLTVKPYVSRGLKGDFIRVGKDLRAGMKAVEIERDKKRA